MTGPSVRLSAYYSAPVDRFLTTEPYHVLGALASAHSHDLEVEQRQAWEEELLILKEALTALTGTLFLEFDVPLSFAKTPSDSFRSTEIPQFLHQPKAPSRVGR